VKAVVYTRYGSPSVLRLTDVPKPVPAANELLINVRATTVNRTDCGFRQGDPYVVRLFAGLTRPKRPILGSEFAGVVDEVGPDVHSFRVGDEVFGLTGVAFGAHAEYLCLPDDAPVGVKPAGVGFDDAAAACDGAMNALTHLRKAHVGPGQRVLVYGASGSIGTAAVQLAVHLGADVTAVCGTRNVELVRSLGADTVIDYLKTDFTRDGPTYDLVLDAVGRSSFGRCRQLLKDDGVYSSTDLGPWDQNPLLDLATFIAGGRRVRMPIPRPRRDDVMFFGGLMEAGSYRPVIDRRYPLERLVEATRYVELGQKTGNVVITVG